MQGLFIRRQEISRLSVILSTMAWAKFAFLGGNGSTENGARSGQARKFFWRCTGTSRPVRESRQNALIWTFPVNANLP